MKNYIFQIAVLLGAVILLGACDGKTERPNIILILADDFGYMDCNAYAQHTLGTNPSEMFYETPHLDRLAREGLAFSRAYANQLCSPTRAAILTGKYAGRVGFTTAMPHRDTYYNQGLDRVERNSGQGTELFQTGTWRARGDLP